jgi:hypothetical protein
MFVASIIIEPHQIQHNLLELLFLFLRFALSLVMGSQLSS